MPAREFLNVVEALKREDVMRMYAGDPQAMSEALDDLDDAIYGDGGVGVGLDDPGRDAAWAQLGGG